MSRVFCNAGTNASKLMSPNGTFHRRAIDTFFIQDNGCSDPCNQINNLRSIFRSQNELVLLPHSQALLWNFTIPGPKYAKAERMVTLLNKNLAINWWSLPFILVQGFITALFGRRDPREIRDLIYITLFMEHPISQRPYLFRTQEVIVRVFAGLNYLIACAVIIFCIPFFVISVISQEFQLWYEQPDSEKPYMVGQWSSWVYTALVVLAALIARYHDSAIRLLAKGCRHMASCFSRHKRQPEPSPEHGLEPKPTTAQHPTEKSWIDSSAVSVSAHSSENPTTTTTTTHILHTLFTTYRSSTHPLNQTGNGPIDELRNFIHWCRNPQETSRLVIRHPIRARDTRFIDAPPAVVDAAKGDPRARSQERNFFRGVSVEDGSHGGGGKGFDGQG